MAYYSAGRLIQEFRQRKGISQEEFCEGICSISTLSRIESCRQNPSKKVLEALLDRAGIKMGLFNIAVTDEEQKRSQIEDEINSRVYREQYNYKDLLDEYWDQKSEIDNLDLQFYKYAEALYLQGIKADNKEVLQRLVDALKITYSKFDMNNLQPNKLLSIRELTILNNIAVTLVYSGNKEQGRRIFKYMIDHYETADVEADVKARKLPLAVYNYINCVDITLFDQNTIDECNKGIACCRKSGKFTMMPYLLYSKAFALCNMNRKEEGRELFLQAITIFEILESYEEAAWYSLFCNEHFDLGLPVKMELNPERRKLFFF